MLVPFTIAVTLACQSTFPSDPPFPSDPCNTTRPIDGLMNGDFELYSPCTDIGTSHGCGQRPLRGPYADGGFWVGAEGMTRTANAGANRFFSIRPASAVSPQLHEFIYQRAGAAPEFTPLTQIEARVRLRKHDDEARITMGEPDGDSFNLTSFMGANLGEINYANLGAGSTAPLNPDHPDALWRISEEDNGTSFTMCWHYPACGMPSSVPQPMCGSAGVPPSCAVEVANCQNFVAFFREHTPLQLCPAVGGASALGNNEAHAQAHLTIAASVTRKVVATFVVPKKGFVRLGMRAWRPATHVAGPQADALVEVLHERNGSTGVVRCMEIPGDELEGRTALDRLAVEQGDLLHYKVSKLEDGLICDVFFDPSICYEGKRLTYRVFRAGASVSPPLASHALERFQTLFVADNAQWQALTLTPGADWAQHWPAPPLPPLEIELAAPSDNLGAVDFDDVRALVHYCDASAGELETEIESYLGWARQISSWNRDAGHDGYADPAPPNPDPRDENVRGPLATPYEAFKVRALTGEAYNGGFGPIGQEPEGLWDRLQIDFDASDYADWCWFREQEWFHRHPVTERVYSEYDILIDEFTGLLPGNACQDTSFAEWVQGFELTNDVTLLSHAALYTQAAADYGVNQTGAVCDNYLIEIAPLDTCGAPPPPNTSSPRLIDALAGACELVRTYCAVERWKVEHAGSTYFDSFNTTTWLRRARAALVPVSRRLNDYLADLAPWDPTCTDPTPCDATTWSGVTWHQLPGALDDYFGYLAGDAEIGVKLRDLIALKLQLGGTPTADEIDVSAQLNCLVDSGVANLLPAWFECTLRGDPNAADQVRGWPYFLPRASTVAACDPTLTAGRQLVLASQYWTRFQYRGVWINAFEQQGQLVDLAGAAGKAAIPPHYYLHGFLLALQASTDPAEREDLRDQLYTILRRTRLDFRDAWGLQYGFALHPVGWQGYTINAATLPSVFHQRTIDALVRGVSGAGWPALGVPRPAAPRVSIDPPSLVQASGQSAFSLVLRVPGETNATLLQSALSQRTEVGWWRETAGDWEYEILWPPQAGSPWASFAVQAPIGDEIELLLSVQPGYPDPFLGAEFKLDMHAWDAKGQWHRDTSYQQW